MKSKVLTTTLAVLSGLFMMSALPQEANAGHSSHSRKILHNCNHCHRPVYAYRQIAYYDSCGRPIYRWVTHSHSGCSRSSRHHSRGGNYYYHGGPRHYYSSPGYNYRSRSYCRPRSGFSFFWRF